MQINLSLFMQHDSTKPMMVFINKLMPYANPIVPKSSVPAIARNARVKRTSEM
jgi:hypothetical protein